MFQVFVNMAYFCLQVDNQTFLNYQFKIKKNIILINNLGKVTF